MDKAQKEKILKLAQKIEQTEGKGSIYRLNKSSVRLIPRLDTCIEDLNFITGGGLPKGRIIEIFGPESSGKTALALHLCSLVDMSLYIPAEGTFDAERAKVFGNSSNMIVYPPSCGEDAMNKTLEFVKLGIPLVVIDSVPGLVPKSDSAKMNKSFEENKKIGGISGLLSDAIPELITQGEKSGTCIVFINQIRDKMNAMMFGEKTDTPGGRWLKFGASMRIQVGRRDWIKIPNKNPRSSAEYEHIGIVTKCKVIKSKVCNPYGECLIHMIFDTGYVSADEVLEIRNERMKSNKKRKKKEE